jgi:hypothetical protein
VAGQGFAYLFVDHHLVTRLRGPSYRLPAELVPRGTHHVTARLYADDGTVWAVDGKAVESTADITASESGSGVTPDSTTNPTVFGMPNAGLHAGGRASPSGVGKA